MKSEVNKNKNSYPMLIEHIPTGMVILETKSLEGIVVFVGNSSYKIGDKKENFTTYDKKLWAVFSGEVTLSN